ncbi:hypothetical protein EPUL_004143 [Erysiphe pulchra]|uniref:Uncharacterized protein n=1 Tax=Erysiphe pulchra TaxID=225359 RepID=A0A2S4PU98_9PEZI|nr:hypothetical protein EPUL_004143 [Erysiphe pulchra]
MAHIRQIAPLVGFAQRLHVLQRLKNRPLPYGECIQKNDLSVKLRPAAGCLEPLAENSASQIIIIASSPLTSNHTPVVATITSPSSNASNIKKNTTQDRATLEAPLASKNRAQHKNPFEVLATDKGQSDRQMIFSLKVIKIL